MYFYPLFSHVSDPLYLLLFLCTCRVSFPVVTVRLPVALDLGQRRMFNHYWSFLGLSLLSKFLFLCTSITRLATWIFFLVPMHGVLIRIWRLLQVVLVRIWSLLQVAAVGVSGELSRLCMARGLGIYSCSITDREEYIGAFRWGYCLACFVELVHGCL